MMVLQGQSKSFDWLPVKVACLVVKIARERDGGAL